MSKGNGKRKLSKRKQRAVIKDETNRLQGSTPARSDYRRVKMSEKSAEMECNQVFVNAVRKLLGKAQIVILSLVDEQGVGSTFQLRVKNRGERLYKVWVSTQSSAELLEMVKVKPQGEWQSQT